MNGFKISRVLDVSEVDFEWRVIPSVDFVTNLFEKPRLQERENSAISDRNPLM
jgi:hypothetical protein